MKIKTAAAAAIAFCLIFTAGCSDAKTRVSSAASSSRSASSRVVSSRSASSQAVSSAVPGTGSASPKTGSGSTQTASDSGEPDEPDTVSVTIPEGYTLARIAAKLKANGVCGEDDFISTAQTYSFSSYPLVKAMPVSDERAYKLEGYLYPDTYQLYKNMKPKDVVSKLLSNAERRIDGQYSYSGMTTDQIVTLASIIEKEADDSSDMRTVSSVFHNRLKKGMKIQADATITYCTYCLLSPNGPFADKFKYYYNTYRCSGLPAGPICNPGATALNAAANPADTGYYYFITKGGKYYYQKTLDEHKAKLDELGMSDDQ